MEMINILDNKETFVASNCSLTLILYHFQQRLLVLKNADVPYAYFFEF